MPTTSPRSPVPRRSAADRVRLVRRAVAAGAAATFAGLWLTVVGVGGSGAAVATTPTTAPATASTQATTATATDDGTSAAGDDSTAAATGGSLPAVQTGQS